MILLLLYRLQGPSPLSSENWKIYTLWWSSIKASELGSERPTTHLVPQVQREAWAGREMMNTETQVTWSGTGTRILQASASLPGHYLWSPFLFWSPITIRWEPSARLLPILLRWGIRTMSLMPHRVYLQHPAQQLLQSKGSINIYWIMTFLTSAVFKDFKKDALMIDVW